MWFRWAGTIHPVAAAYQRCGQDATGAPQREGLHLSRVKGRDTCTEELELGHEVGVCWWGWMGVAREGGAAGGAGLMPRGRAQGREREGTGDTMQGKTGRDCSLERSR